MKYLVFDTQAEAIAAEAQIALAIGCVKIGVNAASKLEEPNKQATERWDEPQQLLDGRWVIQSPNDEGVVINASLFSKNNGFA